MIIIELIYNLSVLVALSVLSGFIDSRFNRNKLNGKILQGTLFGATAIIGMMYPFVLTEGIIFDGRSIVISLCTLFFGPVSGFIATALAIIYRTYLGGGGIIMGVLVILSSFLTGYFFYNYRSKRSDTKINGWQFYLFGLIVHALMMIFVLTLPSKNISDVYHTISLTIIGIYPLVTVLIGKILIDQELNNHYINTLKEREKLFRTTLYSIGDAVITTDSTGSIRYMNSVAEQITGWKEVEAKGKKLSEVFKIVNEDYGLKVENPVDRVLRDGAIVSLTNHTLLISKDGKHIPISDSGSPIKDSDNKIVGVVLVFRDQTEERKKEKTLLESEEKYRKMISSSPMGMHFYELKKNDDLVFIGSNPAADKLLGIDHTMLQGKTIEQAFPPLANTEVPQRYREAASKGILWATEQVAYKDDKIEGAFEVKAYQTKPNNMVAVFADITERKRFEESLKSSEEKYKMLLDFASDAFFHGDKEGNFITINNKAIDLTGYSREELLSMNMKDLFSKEILDTTPLRYDKLLTGETIKSKRVIIKKDGKSIYVEMTSKQMPDGTFQSFFRDITEIKAAENEFKNSEEKFRKAFTTSPDSININRLSDGIYVSINKGFTKMTGFTEEEVIGKTSAEIQIWFDIKYRNELVEKLKTTSVIDNFEAKFRMKDGIIKDGLMSVAVIELNGEPHIISITRDITEHKQAEKRLEQFFSVNLDLLCIADVEGNFIKVNKAWEDILGYPALELEHRKFLEFVHPEDMDSTLEAMATLGKQEQVLNFINRYRCLDGSYRFLEWRSQPSGNLIYAAARDITEYRLAEKILKENELKLNESQRVAQLGHYDFDVLTGTWTCSQMLNNLFGIDHSFIHDLAGWSELIHPDDRELMLDHLLNHVIKEKNRFNKEYRIVRQSDKKERWVNGLGDLEFDNNGNSIKMFGTIQDITERKKAEIALIESEELYRKLISTSPDAVSVVNVEGKIAFVSNKSLQLYGNSSLEEVIGHSLFEWVAPQDHEKAENNFKSLVGGKAQTDKEFLLVKKDGTIFFGEISGAVFYSADGQPNGIILVTRDISDRKKTEESIRKLSQAVEQSPVIIVITDLEGCIEYINPKFTEATGYNLEEVKGQNINILKSDTKDKYLFKSLWETISAGNTWRGEIKNKKKNGKLYWEETVISPILDSKGNIINFISVGEDITERKKLLTEIIGSEEKFRSIWENSVDAMRLVDENGVIINVNNSYCNLFGLTKEDLIGNLFNLSYVITETNTSLNGFKERFKSETILKKFETEIQLKSGKAIWVELTNTFIKFENKATMLLSIIRDITDRKVMIKELTDAKEKAEEMIRLKSYFFANMSHELRTPFVGILGFAEILRDTLQNSDEREYAEQILKSSKRLTDTLNKILNVTKLEFDKTYLSYKEVDICRLLKSVEAFYYNSAKLNNTTISSVLKDESIIVKSDAKLLEDVLNNLVSNAVKFTHDGNIILRAEKIIENKKDYLVIIVEDNGIGIPKDKQSLVWQEFRQASEGLNRSFEGTGLGLTITKKYVEMLGGEISLESEENVGTVFTIKMPVDDKEIKVSEQEIIIPEAVKPAPEKIKNRRYKILYVEDDMVALQFINIILKSSYNVETVYRATAALELIKKEQYDVLMLDINLGSGMDGVQLMQKIREIDYYKNIPIVAVTAYAAQSDKIEFLAKGFTHYISKPFTRNQLLTLLKDVLSN
jgi:PAS domain S-box-containing protein